MDVVVENQGFASPPEPDVIAEPTLVGILLKLTRPRITIAVTFTAAVGFILFRSALTIDFLYVIVGMFMLAAGSSALNQVQEVATDQKMARTASRPIPAKHITRSAALGWALAFIALGINLVIASDRHQLTVLGLSLFSVFWYNGVYTWLKKVTAFAVVPGALIGALPPVIGYVAAGGMWNDPQILAVAGFFFIWQIPHFWLLVLHYGEEYTAAGLPSLTAVFAREQLARLTFMWIVATAVCGVFVANSILVVTAWTLVVLLASAWLALSSLQLILSRDQHPAYMTFFLRINAYCLLLMLALCFGA